MLNQFILIYNGNLLVTSDVLFLSLFMQRMIRILITSYLTKEEYMLIEFTLVEAHIFINVSSFLLLESDKLIYYTVWTYFIVMLNDIDQE
jgi:hypothetical protein